MQKLGDYLRIRLDLWYLLWPLQPTDALSTIYHLRRDLMLSQFMYLINFIILQDVHINTTLKNQFISTMRNDFTNQTKDG